MLVVASVGLGVNLYGVYNLRKGSEESLNVRGAFLEVVSDTLGSIGVIVAALIMYFTGWYYADPIFSVLIGLFILPRTWKLLMEAINILLEGTPAHINLKAVEETMRSVPDVASVHDLHVWTITSGIDALSAHVVFVDSAAPQNARAILETLNGRLREQFKIEHTTIQIEQKSLAEKEMRL